MDRALCRDFCGTKNRTKNRRSFMGKKKKEHAGFEQMISKKNNTPFAKVGNKYSAQAAPKKMIQQRRMGAK
jgi:hypothetical protein